MRTFTYESKSGGGDHTTTAHDDGRITCSCRGFRSKNGCWHLKATAEKLGLSVAAMVGNSITGPAMRTAPKEEATLFDEPVGAFIKPMLASALPANFAITPNTYAASEKIDGHRLIVAITKDSITAWSRNGKTRDLPQHILTALKNFPPSTLDGELMVPGGQSHNVTELTQTKSLVYAVFDILWLLDQDTTHATYDTRQGYLSEMFSRPELQSRAVMLVESRNMQTMAEVKAFTEEVWAQKNGEGLILKRRAATYQVGKRSRDFLKIKQLHTAVLTIIGFAATKGKVMSRGEFATVLLRDDAGIETSVKTLDDAELAKFNKHPAVNHPAIGRRLRIEFQARTADGSYRHPRWDRFEDE